MVPETIVMSSDSDRVVWQMVKAGYGLPMLPEILGDAASGLEKALPDQPRLQLQNSPAIHREFQTDLCIRLAFDTLVRG